MFYRRKPNKSGSFSIQILRKHRGRNRLIKTIGSSKSEYVLRQFEKLAEEYIENYKGQLALDLLSDDQKSFNWFDQVQNSIEYFKLLGPELILGNLFEQIGFHQIPVKYFRELVISRIIYPSSKLKTVRYIQDYLGQEVQVDSLYRLMDKIYEEYTDQIQTISYKHTISVLGAQPKVLFYDVTTIYFESEKGDEMRRTGFSKEGKHRHPQILLGLLVSEEGYPLAFEIFEGNKYEGHTMLPIIDKFREKFDLDNLVVVADSGLMTSDNVKSLQAKNYSFILGARIKSEKQSIKDQILQQAFANGQCYTINKSDATRLIVQYSEKRAKKDQFNRQRGIERLEKAVKSNKLSKSNINNRGYNKYLIMEGEVEITIDYEKVNSEKKWDGLKGYITNLQTENERILAHYKSLWKIEKAFRISKTDLRIRPIYHRLERRIRTHILISFVAYKLYKELERQLKIKQVSISVERSIELLVSIYGIRLIHPIDKSAKTIIHANLEDQKVLLKAFNINIG